MDRILSFRDLEVWQLAMDLVDAVIVDLRTMPRIEFDLKTSNSESRHFDSIERRRGLASEEETARVPEPRFHRDGLARRT